MGTHPSAGLALILTQDFDPTVDPVVMSVKEKGGEVFRLDLSYFPQRLTVTSSDFGVERRSLRHRDRVLDLDRVTGVWYRRPTPFAFHPEMGEAERQFSRNEAIQGVGGILRSTHCLWINRPDADAVAELKPYQLAVAKRVGLRVPRTLITNDPAEVHELIRTSGRPIAYKAFTGGVIHYPGSFPNGLLTTVVGDEITEHLDRVRHTMCMFQEYVDKAYEVRLTVIGNTFFPVTIRSQDVDATTVDWRGADQLPYGEFEYLPDDVVDKVQRLLAELNLAYAAVDFIVTPDGEYVFLEANPNGQFMWMQHDLGIPFADAVADLLLAGDFRRGEVTQVAYEVR